MTPFVKTLIDVVEAEWERWGGSIWRYGESPIIGGRERGDDYWSVVAEYWKSWDSKSKNHGRVKVAWSGVFIAYCFKKAGVGSNFPYSWRVLRT